MKHCLLFSILILLLTVSASAGEKGKDLNAVPPPEAIRLVNEAIYLSEDDKFVAAITSVKKAIHLAPKYMRAHIEYYRIRDFFMRQGPQVFEEYQDLLKKEPDNPVYLLAAYHKVPTDSARGAYERIIAIAPEWAWAHYAKAMLIRDTEPERAAAELSKCVEMDCHAEMAFQALIELQEKKLNHPDDALRAAEKYAAQSDLRPQRLVTFWRLRLARAGQSREAEVALRAELVDLLGNSHNYSALVAARLAYKDLLKDKPGMDAAEKKILQVDPEWSPYRGWAVSALRLNHSGMPAYFIYFVNRQVGVYNKVMDIRNNTVQEEQLIQFGGLIEQTADQTMRRIIYDEIFKAAIRTGDARNALKYSLLLRRIDPDDTGLLSQTALVLSERKIELTQALGDAQAAEKATAEFHPARLKGVLTEDKEREIYRQQRALAMNALGWTLFQMGRKSEAEPWLRQSVEMSPTEKSLKHFAKALREAGRDDEAAKLIAAAETAFAEAVRKRIVRQDVADFQVTSASGRQYSLGSLKGKVVLLNFWATWCGPCLQEMPYLKRLYDKYMDKGFEVFSISIDEDGYGAQPVITKHNLPFPVFVAPALGERFNAQTVPLNVFIDRKGMIRYRKVGFDEDSEREFEIVMTELLNP
jgi:thiol-disulfide isomerase/thioredoxin